MSHSIYRIDCVANNKTYVGCTNNFKVRKSQHVSELKNQRHRNAHLQSAFNLYGRRSFKFSVIERGIDTSAMAEQRERYWIQELDTYNSGFNLTEGGYAPPPPPVTIPCVWEGVHYKSIAEAARAIGTDEGTMYHRIRKGYTQESDLNPFNQKAIIWEGIEYPSVIEASEATGISYVALIQRINNGYVTEDEMTFNNEWRKIPVVWEGVQYDSILEASEALGIKYNTMQQRVELGYTCDADLPTPGGIGAKSAIWNGITYPSIRSCAKAIGTTHTRLRRMLRKGYTCDDDLKHKQS